MLYPAGSDTHLPHVYADCAFRDTAPVLMHDLGNLRGSVNLFRIVVDSLNLFLHLLAMLSLTCGRYMRGERFAYKRYTNLVTIYRDEKLIYRDNVQFRRHLFDMSGMGMFEQYMHMASIFISKPRHQEAFVTQTYELLQEAGQHGLDGNGPLVEGGITELSDGDYAVRIFGTRAQSLERLKERIMDLER